MKKILFFTSNYYPKPTANGICVNNVMQELIRKGYEVHLICYDSYGAKKEEVINEVKVHRVKMPLFFKIAHLSEGINNFILAELYKKISRIIKHFKLFMYLPFFPVTSIKTIYHFYRKADQLHQEHHFDIVVSSFNPIEGLAASNLLKRKHKDFKLGMYVLDSLSNTGDGNFLGGNLKDSIGWAWEKRLYPKADLILNMKSHQQHHQQARYQDYQRKMKYVDIPLFLPNQLAKNGTQQTEHKKRTIVYTGRLDSQIRSPEYASELFKQMDPTNYKVDFYSRGDSEIVLAKYEEETQGLINRKGFVTHEESQRVIQNATFLLSIGNKNSDMVPSKIFEYMSTGKPIIHFFDTESDSSLGYLNKYPLAILIQQDEALFDKNIKKLEAFMEKHKKSSVDQEALESIFELNKPDYTAKLIDNLLQ